MVVLDLEVVVVGVALAGGEGVGDGFLEVGFFKVGVGDVELGNLGAFGEVFEDAEGGGGEGDVGGGVVGVGDAQGDAFFDGVAGFVGGFDADAQGEAVFVVVGFGGGEGAGVGGDAEVLVVDVSGAFDEVVGVGVLEGWLPWVEVGGELTGGVGVDGGEGGDVGAGG